MFLCWDFQAEKLEMDLNKEERKKERIIIIDSCRVATIGLWDF
jgi:hypothetical protein